MNGSTEQPSQDSTPTITEPVSDLQLQLLIRLLGEDPRSWLPITLNVPGGVVYGDLITREAWKADWAQSLRRVRSVGSDLLARFPETVDQAVDELRGDDGSQHLPRWIHLRNVTVTTGGVSPDVEVPVWRGRLSDVAGWALGRPEPDEH
ncbi:hypothetical protein [Streptomyces sp. NBC_00370]|uniref:hypothetical protein n=1 Tax=Streptomyces sp. NBC_00370 TaxID=2975728 RepID=UPI002E2669B1